MPDGQYIHRQARQLFGKLGQAHSIFFCCKNEFAFGLYALVYLPDLVQVVDAKDMVI